MRAEGLAWAGGGCVGRASWLWSPSRQGPCAEEHTTAATREKRACSQHIYILCDIYIVGIRICTQISTVSAPERSSCCSPWRKAAVQRDNHRSAGAGLWWRLRRALRLAPGVGWRIENGKNRSKRGAPQSSL